jgi:hypothetical protein
VDVDVDVDLTEPTPSFLERYARPILLTASALLVLVIGLCVLWAMNQ